MTGTAAFTTPGGIDVTSILLTPQPITKDNLDVVIDAGWTTKENVCKGVDGRFGPRLLTLHHARMQQPTCPPSDDSGRGARVTSTAQTRGI